MLKSTRIMTVILDSTVEGYLGFWSDDMKFKTGVLRKRGDNLRMAVRFWEDISPPGGPAV